MACATLKRPLEWSDPSMSPPSAHNSGHKDSHHSRAKRRCISSVITPQINKEVSHFGDVQPILSSGLHFLQPFHSSIDSFFLNICFYISFFSIDYQLI